MFLERHIKEMQTWKDSDYSELRGQGVNNEDLTVIVNALNKNQRVTCLDLGKNNLGDFTEQEINAAHLANLKHVTNLIIDENNVSLKEALVLVCRFEKLNLSRNFLSKENDGAKIEEKLGEQLIYLNLERNGMPKEVLDKIQKKIEANKLKNEEFVENSEDSGNCGRCMCM